MVHTDDHGDHKKGNEAENDRSSVVSSLDRGAACWAGSRSQTNHVPAVFTPIQPTSRRLRGLWYCRNGNWRWWCSAARNLDVFIAARAINCHSSASFLNGKILTTARAIKTDVHGRNSRSNCVQQIVECDIGRVICRPAIKNDSSAICGSLKSPLCSCVSITLPAAS